LKNRREKNMANVLERGISGKCEGECRDQVRSMEKENRKKIDESAMRGSPEETASMAHAKSRSSAPGVLGGHV
jgi:hypothetical protein